MKNSPKRNKFSYICYRIFRFFVWLFYPQITVEGLENLPQEPCVVVGNHTQMNGPICGEIYFPGERAIWCAGQMMETKEVPEYAFEDFWSRKPKWTHPFYRILSYLIAPLAACIFKNARTIGVYRDSRILSTFKQTVQALQEGKNIIVFPESYTPHNHIVYAFQDRFVEVAKLYYKRTGKILSFVPLYIAPKLRKMYLGEPIRYNPDAPAEEERKRICDYLMAQITDIAVHLPPHRVVPYPNLSRKQYPLNIQEDTQYEETGG